MHESPSRCTTVQFRVSLSPVLELQGTPSPRLMRFSLVRNWIDSQESFNSTKEFQVKFCHPSELRLWRTGMLLLIKFKDQKSNVLYQWTDRYLLFVHFEFKYPVSATYTIAFWDRWPYRNSSTKFTLLLYPGS